jgi:hypothetical protein
MYPVPTLTINSGDYVQFQGNNYLITAVAAGALSSLKDEYVYALTTSIGTINATIKRMVRLSVNTLGTQFWVYSA